MILQKEIREKAQSWGVPPDTVDKDYVLGHFLSEFISFYQDQLVFKGGTCLRKCYIENYRFSEDLDFTAVSNDFLLEVERLIKIIEKTYQNTGIQFYIESIKPLIFENTPKGYQVYLKYWGANHSKNQPPPSPDRWVTKLKLEISTDELLLDEPALKKIMHPYSDSLTGSIVCPSYSIYEIVSEKLRALKQRSYTAPRDFYDLYYLTGDFKESNWQLVFDLFIKKMNYKNLKYQGKETFVSESATQNAIRAWDTSVAHQLSKNNDSTGPELINEVVQRIKLYLPQ